MTRKQTTSSNVFVVSLSRTNSLGVNLLRGSTVAHSLLVKIDSGGVTATL